MKSENILILPVFKLLSRVIFEDTNITLSAMGVRHAIIPLGQAGLANEWRLLP